MNQHNLEQNIKISFTNKQLLNKALTHSSYANEHNTKSNERLEYIGDAVLGLMMGEYLFKLFPNTQEGKLTKIRAKYVCESALVLYAKKIELPSALLLGKGEEKTGGRNRDSVLADAFEALLGAIYLDKGLEVCKDFFNRIIVPFIGEESNEVFVDHKSMFQELVHSDKRTVTYKIIDEKGPSHDKVFTAAVYMDTILMGTGSGKTKQKAEQAAAKKALELKANKQGK